jgi:MYXO-CTERM domain-containing protein
VNSFDVQTSFIQRGTVPAVPAGTPGTVEAETGIPCAAGGEGRTVFICAHWDSPTPKVGKAVGQFKIQVAKPAAPTGVSAESGDGKLIVRWSASTGSPNADRYFARATPLVGGVPTGSPVDSVLTNSTNVTLGGLTNNTTYEVVVFALSVGRNPSDASAAAQGTPIATDDFWEHYRTQPGAREQGGCASGGAGPLAILGVAALLARARRRK